VLLGARRSFDETFPAGGMMDAVEGRQADPILQDIDADAAHDRLNMLVIIDVGDNGLIDAGTLRRTLGRLHGKRVIVVNNRVDRPWQDPNNHTITSIVGQFGNVRLLDWHRASATHPDWFYDDGIHLTPPGATAYARLISTLARTF